MPCLACNFKFRRAFGLGSIMPFLALSLPAIRLEATCPSGHS
jgi:hypothetical protein